MTPGAIQVAGLYERVWIGRRGVEPPRGAVPIPPDNAAGMVDELFAPRSGSRASLFAICRELGVEPSGTHLIPDRDLRMTLSQALERGRVHAFRMPKPIYRALEKVELEEYVPEDMRPSEAETSWISIQLIDDESSPVPGEAYEIEAADGTVLTGRLDKQGFARVDGIAKGNAKVRFPDLDPPSWSKA